LRVQRRRPPCAADRRVTSPCCASPPFRIAGCIRLHAPILCHPPRRSAKCRQGPSSIGIEPLCPPSRDLRWKRLRLDLHVETLHCRIAPTAFGPDQHCNQQSPNLAFASVFITLFSRLHLMLRNRKRARVRPASQRLFPSLPPKATFPRHPLPKTSQKPTGLSTPGRSARRRRWQKSPHTNPYVSGNASLPSPLSGSPIASGSAGNAPTDAPKPKSLHLITGGIRCVHFSMEAGASALFDHRKWELATAQPGFLSRRDSQHRPTTPDRRTSTCILRASHSVYGVVDCQQIVNEKLFACVDWPERIDENPSLILDSLAVGCATHD
jgi:hypothetical protein